LQVSDESKNRKLPQHDFGTPEVYQTPSSFRVMTWKTETIEGKSFSFKYDTATCSVVIYNMFDACFFNPALYIYPPQAKFGMVYRNHPVRPSVHVPCKRNS
jgi:hypothetical protein